VKLRRSDRGYKAVFCGLFCHPRVQKTYGRIAQKSSLSVVLALSKGPVGGTTEEDWPNIRFRRNPLPLGRVLVPSYSPALAANVSTTAMSCSSPCGRLWRCFK